MREKQNNYIPTLDGWRAVAILGVMIAHGTNVPYHTYGTLGVDVFFGISGFLICTRLLQEAQEYGRISLPNFYARRAFRILPPYFVYLAGLFLLASFGFVGVGRWEWLSCFLFFRNYLPLGLGGWYTGHFWSLAVEEHFYLLWPGLLVLCGIKRARHFAVSVAVLLAAWRVFEFRHHVVMSILPGVGFYERTDIRFDALLLGCWAALLLMVARPALNKLTAPANWFVVAILFVACVAIQPPLAMLWQSLLIPALLLGTVLHPKSYAGMLLESSALRWIGRLSYSLYLWQQMFLVPPDVSKIQPLGILQEWPWNFAAVFVFAALSYYIVEKPMVRIGHRLTVAVNTDEGCIQRPVTA